jgi:hypothetical protein
MTALLAEYLSDATEDVDLPGHCKWCGRETESEDFLMYDPDGRMPPIPFCSAAHLDKASRMFEGLAPEHVAVIERETTVAEIADRKARGALDA